MRIIHLSDIHVWRFPRNPLRLLNKRLVGVASLLAGRARKFRLERLEEVVERVRRLQPDHILITGDVSTTALAGEFRQAREALGDLLDDPARVTVIPGNHDRYTTGSVRSRAFERFFGEFSPDSGYPWLRMIDAETGILGLDPTRPHLSARGFLPPNQLAMARDLLAQPGLRPRRLIIACHYPVVAPPLYEQELHHKRMTNAAELIPWLSTLGPHVYCCGHVHAAWSFRPPTIPGQLCLNSGAPLLRDPTGHRPPGFLEITLHHNDISVNHHAWLTNTWDTRPLFQDPGFFKSLV